MQAFKTWLPVFIALMFAVGVYYLLHVTLDGAWPALGSSDSETVLRANLGALGDAIGGILNPLFMLITIVLLIQTLLLTRATLKSTEDQLAISNEELSLSRQEMQKATAAQQEMVVIQDAQKKENAFFEVCRIYVAMIDRLHTKGEFGKAEAPICEALSACYNTSRDTKDVIESVYKNRFFIRSLIKQTILMSALSENNLGSDIIFRSTLTPEVRAFLYLFAFYIESEDALLIKNIIKKGSDDNEMLVYASTLNQDAFNVFTGALHGFKT